MFSEMWPTLKRATMGAADDSIARDRVSEVPLASISARIGRNARGMMVLMRRQGDLLYWYAQNKLILVTRFGRIVQTGGLPANLRGVESLGEDPFAVGLHLLTGPVTTTYTYDVETEEGYASILVDAKLEVVREEEITISGLQFSTLRLRERCKARGFKWKFENRYWVDTYDGLVWRSRQEFSPEFPGISLETLKPAS